MPPIPNGVPMSWYLALSAVLFVIGVAGFVASIMFLAALLMIAAPVLYQMIPYVIGTERIATSEEALLVSLIGFVLLLIWTHAINGMASLTRWMAEGLL